MPKLISNSSFGKFFRTSFQNGRQFPKITSNSTGMNITRSFVQPNMGSQSVFSSYFHGHFKSHQQRQKSTVTIWDDSGKRRAIDSRDDDESLKRFAYGYAKIVRADRQEPGGNKSNSMPQKTQDEDVFELNSSSEYDICNTINSMEINHHDRDFDVFGYMEKKIEAINFISHAAHAATTSTSSYPSPSKEKEEDEMLEEYLRRDSDRMFDTEVIYNNKEKQNIQENDQDSINSYVSVNWENNHTMKNDTENKTQLFENCHIYPSAQNRFSKRRKKRWIIPGRSPFSMRQDKQVNLDIVYHDTLVGLQQDTSRVDAAPTGARNFIPGGTFSEFSAAPFFGYHVDLHGKEGDEIDQNEKRRLNMKNKRRKRQKMLMTNDINTTKINKQRICQQLQQVNDLVSGYGGGYSESVPELETEYCQDITAQERYNHLMLQKNQKRLKHAGFNIPPLGQNDESLHKNTNQPVTNFNLKVSYDWSKVEK